MDGRHGTSESYRPATIEAPDASARLPGPRAARVPALHGADRRSSTATSSASGWRRRSPGSRCSTSSATPSPPAAPGRRPRSRSTSSPATPRTPARSRCRAGPRRCIALAGPVTHITAGFAVLAGDGRQPARRGQPRQHAGGGRGLVGRAGDRRLQPDPGAAARRRQRRDVGCSTASCPGRARPVDDLRQRRRSRSARPSCFAFTAQTAGFTVFLGFLLVMQLQLLFDERDAPRRVAVRRRRRGAARRRRRRRPARIVVNGLRRPSAVAVVPRTLDDDELAALLALLPRPLPYGDPWNEYVLTNLLVRAGELRRGGAVRRRELRPRRRSRCSPRRSPAPPARSATRRRRWPGCAPPPTAARRRDGLATVIDQAPELAAVRQRPDVVALRNTLDHSASSGGR